MFHSAALRLHFPQSWFFRLLFIFILENRNTIEKTRVAGAAGCGARAAKASAVAFNSAA